MCSAVLPVGKARFPGAGLCGALVPGRARSTRAAAAGAGVAPRPGTRAAPRQGAGTALGCKPGPLHKLLIEMGGEGCCAAAPA